MASSPERFRLREFGVTDVDAAVTLWRATEGICVREDDAPEPLALFLARNPGLSAVAESEADGRLIGAVLGGHDGRRGFLYHLAVDRSWRGRGVGRALVERCLDALTRAGIARCHIVALADNTEGIRFWERLGFRVRAELQLCTRVLP